MRVPEAAGAGITTAEISLGPSRLGEVASTRLDLEIRRPLPGPKLETVSARLKGSLIHTNRENVLCGLRFSPDGKQTIAGDYPGGVVQVWELESGKQLTKIETAHERQSDNSYFAVAPDWQKVYAFRHKRKLAGIEKEGKKLIREDFEGDMRAWDLNTGELLYRLKHNPPTGIFSMRLSPEGNVLMTAQYHSTESENHTLKSTCGFWDLQSREFRLLPKIVSSGGIFSPDGKFVAAGVLEREYVTAIKIFDVASVTEKLSMPVAQKGAQAGPLAFSADGKKLIVEVRAYPAKGDYSTFETHLKFWDVVTGKELASFAAEEKLTAFWGGCCLSPDGKSLAAVNLHMTQPRLYMFDLERISLAWKIDLCARADAGHRFAVYPPVFSPDGKWIAVTSQQFAMEESGRPISDQEPHQARIHLVSVDSHAVVESIVTPPGHGGELCFSPDGKTLASTAQGKVLLWDLTKPLGTVESQPSKK